MKTTAHRTNQNAPASQRWGWAIGFSIGLAACGGSATDTGPGSGKVPDAPDLHDVLDCEDEACAEMVSGLPCTEEGVREAIESGGGPHTFACDGPTTIMTGSEILIERDLILDGRDQLILDGGREHTVLVVAKGITVELRGLSVTRGASTALAGGIANHGVLRMVDSTVANNTGVEAGGIWNGGVLTIASSEVITNSGDETGGVANMGVLTMIDSMVKHNVGDIGGIRNSGTMSLTKVPVDANTGVRAGGIWNEGTLATMGATIEDNIGDSAGGIANEAGTLTMEESFVIRNVARSTGGIWNGSGATFMRQGCIVSRNVGDDVAGIWNEASGGVTLQGSFIGDECAGEITSAGNNLMMGGYGPSCGFDASQGDADRLVLEGLDTHPWDL